MCGCGWVGGWLGGCVCTIRKKLSRIVKLEYTSIVGYEIDQISSTLALSDQGQDHGLTLNLFSFTTLQILFTILKWTVPYS